MNAGLPIDPVAFANLVEMTGGDYEFIDDLVDTYLEEGVGLIAGLRAAATSGVADDLVRPAHSLTSSSQNIGATGLADACRSLEEEARGGAVPDDPEYLVPIGKARIARAGEHVTIVAFSRMVKLALQAAEELEKAGISAEVVDLRSLRPLDVETVVESVKKTNRIISVEEGWPFAGIGSEIAAIVMEECFDWLDAPLKRVTGKDVPLPYAANLERLAVPQVEDIVAAAHEVTYR
jgi:HPt (histidine-containing phosphotransfer) domain-containing protein